MPDRPIPKMLRPLRDVGDTTQDVGYRLVMARDAARWKWVRTASNEDLDGTLRSMTPAARDAGVDAALADRTWARSRTPATGS